MDDFVASWGSKIKTPSDPGQIERLLLERVSSLEARARIILAIGQCAEQCGDFERAAGFYRQAMSIEPEDADVWYFIHNNLGYCLIQLGRFDEAERCCGRAMGMVPGRPNAHKNLGLAFQGQGRYADAARCFVAATRANAYRTIAGSAF